MKKFVFIKNIKKRLNKKKNFNITKFKKSFGKNNLGHIICNHKGGGQKNLYRYIDFWYANYGLKSTSGYVFSIHYDPNRNSHLALIGFINGFFKGRKIYFLPPKNLKIKSFLNFGEKETFNIGNSKALNFFSLGSYIYNIELKAGKGATLVRSPGTSAKLISFIKKYAQIKLPSGNFKLIPINCFATLGIVYDIKYLKKSYFKAGLSKFLNKRSKVRGVAKNAYDHPHGGGEGRSRIGKKFSKTPWGKPAIGMKTKSKKQLSNSFIIKRNY